MKRTEEFTFFTGHFGPWRLAHHVASKRQAPTSQWCGAKSHKNKDLNCTAV